MSLKIVPEEMSNSVKKKMKEQKCEWVKIKK
jgi:hypothetical protein